MFLKVSPSKLYTITLPQCLKQNLVPYVQDFYSLANITEVECVLLQEVKWPRC